MEETIPLTADNGPSVSDARQQTTASQIDLDINIQHITCGIAWDFLGKKVDLDITVVVLDTYSFEIDAAYFKEPSILQGAILHSGDDKAGLGDGDDELIRVDLSRLPKNCSSPLTAGRFLMLRARVSRSTTRAMATRCCTRTALAWPSKRQPCCWAFCLSMTHMRSHRASSGRFKFLAPLEFVDVTLNLLLGFGLVTSVGNHFWLHHQNPVTNSLCYTYEKI